MMYTHFVLISPLFVNHAQARLQRASTLLRLGRLDDAERDFTELVMLSF